MSLIQIDKKAITQDDARALVDQTCALQDPFGIPTFHVRDRDYVQMPYGMGFLPKDKIRDAITQTVGARVDEFLEEYSSNPNYINLDIDRVRAVTGVVGAHIYDNLKHGVFNAQSLPVATSPASLSNLIFNGSFRIAAQNQDPEEYQEPEFCFVVTPASPQSLGSLKNDYISRGFQNGSVARSDLPGFPEQYQFATLWHEIGHGTGAEEPQTETMSACVSKKAFENTAFLSARADLRALDAIAHGGKRTFPLIGTTFKNIYGWPMVEANDYVQNLPQSTLSDISEEDIKAIRFQKFDHLARDVQKVSDLLRANTQGLDDIAINDKAFKTLAHHAGALSSTADLTDNQLQIMTRFQLACARLYHGAAAYEDGNDLIDDVLLQSERNTPITFDPNDLNLG